MFNAKNKFYFLAIIQIKLFRRKEREREREDETKNIFVYARTHFAHYRKSFSNVFDTPYIPFYSSSLSFFSSFVVHIFLLLLLLLPLSAHNSLYSFARILF